MTEVLTIKKGDIVTKSFDNLVSSNTYIVDSILIPETTGLISTEALVFHPLFPTVLLREDLSNLNQVSANLKDSSERSLDFANGNKSVLDYNTVADLEALCMYFVVRRKITPRQKHMLSSICGSIASIKFNDDVKLAMDFVKKNEGLLDEFNGMWYRNFKGLFSGQQQITSKKQKDAVFNITGFVLAESENPSVPK